MQIILTLLCVITSTAQTVFRKQYGLKYNHATFFFGGMTALFAMLFFVVISGGMCFSASVLPYSIGFALCYAAATVMLFLAIVTGPIAITSLIISYSLIIPTLYGLIFLKETPGIFQYAGILVSLVSLFFVADKKSEAEASRFSLAWLIYVIGATVTNGLCAVIQKAQQAAFCGSYKNEFMIYSLFIAVIALIAISLIFERKYIVSSVKIGALPAFLCGISNGLTNLLVMTITGIMAASLFFPFLSAGQIIAACIVSVLFYREKLIKKQYAGILLGIIAVVLLNL